MKNLKILALSLFILVLLAGCQVPFTDKHITLPFLEKDPGKVLELAFATMINEVSDYGFESDIRIDLKMDEMVFGDISQGIGVMNPIPAKTGDMKTFTFLEDISGRMEIKDDGRMNTESNMKIEVDIDDSMRYKLELDAKMIDQEVYFKANKLPAIVEMFLPADLFDGWILIPDEDMFMEEDFVYGPCGWIEDGDEYVSTCETKQDDDDQRSQAKEIFKKTTEMIKSGDVLKVDKRLADEKIDENKCYHYQVSLNREYIDRIKSVMIAEYDLDNYGKVPQQEKEDIEKTLDLWGKALKNDSGELWIDKKDFYIRKYDLKFDFDITELNELIKKGIDGLEFNVGYLEFSIQGKLYDFNQGYKAEKPEEYKDLEKLIQENIASRLGEYDPFYGEVLEERGYDPEEEIPDTDSDGLDDLTEEIFGTDPNDPDTDDDGYSDGSEVENGYNPMGEGLLEEYYRAQLEGDDLTEL
ncbi:hypothetical protein GF382_01270 [Candidatus Falkowbacteria bacterium]|nr:hypothetical protein [Candidatus Falkowbacteria bacterium]